MVNYGSEEHQKAVGNACKQLEKEGFKHLVIEKRIPDILAFKGEILFVEVTQGAVEIEEDRYQEAYGEDVPIRIFKFGRNRKVGTKRIKEPKEHSLISIYSEDHGKLSKRGTMGDSFAGILHLALLELENYETMFDEKTRKIVKLETKKRMKRWIERTRK